MGENKRKTGQIYEELAATYLKTRGFQIVERNFYCKFGEIDLIAMDGDCLVFIEIKYRKTAEYGFPQEAVSYIKRKKLIKTAHYYCLKMHVSDGIPMRFDVVAILGKQVMLIKNAFDSFSM